MSNEYSVCLIMDASNNYTVEADTPDEAAKKAEELQWEKGVSLCHQCSGEVDLGDTVGAIVFQDDKMVLDTTHSAQRISCLESERDALAAELQALKSAGGEVRRLREALEGMLEYFPEGASDGECFAVDVARAALAASSGQEKE